MIAVVLQRADQADGILERLGCALARVREHWMRGVAEQGDAAGAPLLQRLADQEFVEPNISGPARAGDGMELRVEVRGAAAHDVFHVQRGSPHVVREERHEPVDLVEPACITPDSTPRPNYQSACTPFMRSTARDRPRTAR